MPLQFVVPQFITVEDKILGPVSVRQFVMFLVGGAAGVLDYQFIYKTTGNFIVFILSELAILALTIVFAFVKINGQPFHFFLLNVFINLKYPRLRVWNKATDRVDYIRKAEKVKRLTSPAVKQQLTPTKLTQLSLVVDTGGAYHEEENVGFDLDAVNRRESLFTPPPA